MEEDGEIARVVLKPSEGASGSCRRATTGASRSRSTRAWSRTSSRATASRRAGWRRCCSGPLASEGRS